jgi:hypothetical protein
MNVLLDIVKDGKVELTTPLPDGTKVEVYMLAERREVPPQGVPAELWEELREWQRLGANTIVDFEQLPGENGDEAR